MNARLDFTIALLSNACVSQGKYDEALKSADDARAATRRAVDEGTVRYDECDANAARVARNLRVARASLHD